MPDYATVDELKAFLRIPEDDETDNAELALAISAASQTLARYLNRTFETVGASATDRYFTSYYDDYQKKVVLPIDDLEDLNGLAFAEVTEAGVETPITTDYRLYPRNATTYTNVIFNSGGLSRNTEVKVTAKWGWSEVPASIKNACLLQASRLFKRRDAPFGIAGSPEMGSELRLLAKLDPDVEVLVSNYKRHWSAA